MKNLSVILLFLSTAINLFAQNTFSLRGNVTDESNTALEAATVYLSIQKDSTVVDYTITNGQGEFDLKVRKQNTPVFLTVSMIGFRDYKQYFEHITQEYVLDNIALEPIATDLEELVIHAEIPPIRIKKDTLEFNASSFKVRPDANVEELLKQLPGVEIDADKNIKVNGREVNQILVNGKPFFDQDGKIALQNLPADLINKVQVTDSKTKKEEFTGKTASSNQSSINFTIDEEKNKGWFGKFMGGYGSDKRYESSGLFNYFKGDRKISFLGSSNNINALGFSMDEVFDNMGGGRSRRMSYGGGRASSSGITQSNMFGINYSDEYGGKVQTTGSYMYNTSDMENHNRSTRINLLPTGEFTTYSESETNNFNENQNLNFSIDYKIDSTSNIYIAPSLSKVYNFSTSIFEEYSEDGQGDLLNENKGLSQNKSNSTNFNNSIRYSKRFEKRGNYFTASFSNSNASQEGMQLNESITHFFQTALSDQRKQRRDMHSTSDSYTLDVEYAQPITDSLSVVVNGNYNWMQSLDDRSVWDFDELTGSYSVKNYLESNEYMSVSKTLRTTAGVHISKTNFNFNIESGVEVTDLDYETFFNKKLYESSQSYMAPVVNLFSRYTLSKGKSIFATYNYRQNYPSGYQVLEIEDISNPLNTIIGNPELKPIESHSVFLSYRSYDFATRSGYGINVNSSFYDNQIVSYVVYDENRKQTTTYRNLSGSYNHSLGLNWNKSYKVEEHQLRLGLNVRTALQKSNGFSEGERYASQAVSVSPSVYLNWDYGNYLSVAPSYSYSYYQTNYSDFMVDKTKNFQHVLGVQLTSYWPENLVFGNDFGYSYNSKIAPGYRKSFYLWNTSLSYAFANKKLIAKVKVYDLLNQNTSSTRTINPTMILDQENTVLKRYVMFSLSYNFDKFGNSKNKERSRSRSRRM